MAGTPAGDSLSGGRSLVWQDIPRQKKVWGICQTAVHCELGARSSLLACGVLGVCSGACRTRSGDLDHDGLWVQVWDGGTERTVIAIETYLALQSWRQSVKFVLGGQGVHNVRSHYGILLCMGLR